MTATPEQSSAAKKPLLERVGVEYFTRRSEGLPKVVGEDSIHFLNPSERAGLQKVQTGAIIRACVAGALSAIASAVAELVATPYAPEGTAFFSRGNGTFWLIMGGVTLIASVLEILFLYWDTLRSVHELAHVAGLNLFGKDRTQADVLIGEALARAALELPNPVEAGYRINPLRESSKTMLLLASFVYKLKVGVTNFLMKMLVRRMLGRVLVRSVMNNFLPFVAVPITAAWNGIVCRLVLREARLRAMGPSAANELVERVFADAPRLSAQGKLATVRAVASAIVRTQDLHPNLLALLTEVETRAGELGPEELDDPGEFLRSLKSLSAPEQKLALQLLVVACIVDGRLSKKEVRLLNEAFAALGRSLDFAPVLKLKKCFVEGDGVAVEALRAIG